MPFVLLILMIPFLLMLLFYNVAAFSFARLGLSPHGAFLFLTACVLGSLINIPLSRRRVVSRERKALPFLFLFFYYPPVVQEQVICVNVGGAGLPVLFSLYLLFARVQLEPTLIAMLLVTVVAKLMARPQPGVGIVMPAFIPPLVAAAAALLMQVTGLAQPGQAAPIAYVAGTIGTLVGADLLNWRAIRNLGAQVVSIGGAGVFDGIFLVGIIAAFLG
jgi:uncharacterized membrane protein